MKKTFVLSTMPALTLAFALVLGLAFVGCATGSGGAPDAAAEQLAAASNTHFRPWPFNSRVAGAVLRRLERISMD